MAPNVPRSVYHVLYIWKSIDCVVRICRVPPTKVGYVHCMGILRLANIRCDGRLVASCIVYRYHRSLRREPLPFSFLYRQYDMHNHILQIKKYSNLIVLAEQVGDEQLLPHRPTTELVSITSAQRMAKSDSEIWGELAKYRN